MSPRNRTPVTVHLSADQLARVRAAAERCGMEPHEFILQSALIQARGWAPKRTSAELRIISREREGQPWPLDELRERGLPLYWNEGWLRAQLAEGRSLHEIAALIGEPARSISNYAHRVYGLQLRVARVDRDVQEQAREMVAQGQSRDEVAAALGLSAASIGTYATGLPDERQKLLRARIAQAGPWPATTQEIGLRVFAGDSRRAAKWAHEMVVAGRLRRTGRGVYDQVQAAPLDGSHRRMPDIDLFKW